MSSDYGTTYKRIEEFYLHDMFCVVNLLVEACLGILTKNHSVDVVGKGSSHRYV